jgi:hypothetical protein
MFAANRHEADVFWPLKIEVGQNEPMPMPLWFWYRFHFWQAAT